MIGEWLCLPTVTETELAEILAGAKDRMRVLFALLAGTGLRIGEALVLKVSDLSSDCRIIRIERSIWRGQEQLVPTENPIRREGLWTQRHSRVTQLQRPNQHGLNVTMSEWKIAGWSFQ